MQSYIKTLLVGGGGGGGGSIHEEIKNCLEDGMDQTINHG